MTLSEQARKWPVIRDRLGYIAGLVQGLDVLDVGCTGTRADGEVPAPASSLHCALCASARSVLGVDIDPKGVEQMRQAGFDVEVGDVATVQLGRGFDVVVAGEIIEHLHNAGQSLRNLASHLRSGGRIVLTTPNPFDCRQQSKILRHGLIKVHLRHTCWYDPQTLGALLGDCGFEVERGAWLAPDKRWVPMGLLARCRRYWNPSFLLVARKASADGSRP
jgi:2-polyprenyl-3-methyl-5-hydroxy-6-metoxy-1,4-benzoquinol methylase